MTIELDDIQGILLSGYPRLPHAHFLLAAFAEPDRGRAWVARVTEVVRSSARPPPAQRRRVHVAFTCAGLRHLELSEQALKGFSREFQEGVAGSDHRSRVLGDRGNSAPARWQWGGPESPAIHVLVMLYAPNAAELTASIEEQRRLAVNSGLGIVHELGSLALPHGKEHFGFRDGISQPRLAGISSSSDPFHVVPAGEFVLGYPNARGDLTASPAVHAIEDPGDILAPLAHTEDRRDFGRNGSYLVFRQLAQDVHGFWAWTGAQSGDDDGDERKAAAIRLASKMVGRWPDGTALTVSPSATAAEATTRNDFGFHHDDEAGLKCPLGAHVRRSNPRDMLPPKPGTDDSLAINRRHRILRRGRAYGAPLVASCDPRDLLGADDDGADRGLHFLCFNASIERQFEFVQSTWANNPNFAGLRTDTDPIIGCRRPEAATFTLQETPFRRRMHDLPAFVEVRGGAYFFLPGIRALRYLASEPARLASAYAAPAPEPRVRPTPWWLKAGRGINAFIEAAVSVTRRFTVLRKLFDRVLQKPLTGLVQWLIQRRRTRRGIDADLGLAEERVLPVEGETAQRITEVMTAFLFKHYRNSTAERAGNTKTYALLTAAFEVEPGLPDELRQGVFGESRTFDAWVRFSGPGPLVTPDIRNNGVLSIGIKLMGVPGPKLLDQEHETQDFTGISAPTFTTPDVYENLKLQQCIAAGVPTFYFLNPFDSHYLDMILQGLYAKAHGSPMETPYWSCVPYLCGEGRAMKYSIVPWRSAKTRVPLPAPDDYLRAAIEKNLESEVCFDFCVQLQTDPQRMPIEDASVIWDSESVKVATLRIPPQEFSTPGRALEARRMTFNPWHAIAAHRPLGNQNRARRLIYLETSRVRQRINGEEHLEPRSE